MKRKKKVTAKKTRRPSFLELVQRVGKLEEQRQADKARRIAAMYGDTHALAQLDFANVELRMCSNWAIQAGVAGEVMRESLRSRERDTLSCDVERYIEACEDNGANMRLGYIQLLQRCYAVLSKIKEHGATKRA